MDLTEAIRERRSIRFFMEKEVESDKIRMVLEAAISAPSASNIQPWHFIAITEKNRIEVIKNFSPGITGNPQAIIICCVNEERIKKVNDSGDGRKLAFIDVAMACQNMLLAAHYSGLGACMIGSLNKSAISKIVNLPDTIVPELIVVLGYPIRSASKPAKLPYEASISYEKFGG